MSFTHTVRRAVYSDSLNVSADESQTGDVEVAISQTVAASASNVEVLVAIDVSALKCLVLQSTNNCTIKTNSSGAPDDTINLVANKPFIWTSGGYHSNVVTADVSKIFITNGAASEMTFQLLALTDTP